MTFFHFPFRLPFCTYLRFKFIRSKTSLYLHFKADFLEPHMLVEKLAVKVMFVYGLVCAWNPSNTIPNQLTIP